MAMQTSLVHIRPITSRTQKSTHSPYFQSHWCRPSVIMRSKSYTLLELPKCHTGAVASQSPCRMCKDVSQGGVRRRHRATPKFGAVTSHIDIHWNKKEVNHFCVGKPCC